MSHEEFAKAVEFQRESIRVQIIEERGLQAMITALTTYSASFLVRKDKAV